MPSWKDAALNEVLLARLNPNHVPRYRMPARRWWQLWKPRWQWIDGVSQNAIRRAHGLDQIHPVVTVARV